MSIETKYLTKQELWKLLDGKTLKCFYECEDDYIMLWAIDEETSMVYIVDEEHYLH